MAQSHLYHDLKGNVIGVQRLDRTLTDPVGSLNCRKARGGHSLAEQWRAPFARNPLGFLNRGSDQITADNWRDGEPCKAGQHHKSAIPRVSYTLPGCS